MEDINQSRRAGYNDRFAEVQRGVYRDKVTSGHNEVFPKVYLSYTDSRDRDTVVG